MAEQARQASATFSVLNPYPGLRSFEPEEDYLFFGRERQIDGLLDHLGETRFLAVVGSSGCGKSSLVRAGLVPSLHSGLLPAAGSGWRVAIMKPGSDPIGNLAAALAAPEVLGAGKATPEAAAGEEAPAHSAPHDDRRLMLEVTLRSSALGLAECVRQATDLGKEKVLVVADQFEELFRLTRANRAARDEAMAFVKLLLAAGKSRRTYVVLTMRSDFMGDCLKFPGLPEAINAGLYLVPRMTRDELRLAITGPAAVRDGRLSPRLVSRLLNDLQDNQDQLPVLQHALMRVWSYWQGERPKKTEIDLEHYEAIGTMDDALSLHAEKVYAGLDSDRDREIAERVFKALTDVDRDGRGIRRQASMSELRAVADAELGEVISVIEAFRAQGRSFLMPPFDVSLDGDSVIDLSHESLMRNWKRLVDWAEEEKASAVEYRRLADAAQLHAEGRAALWVTPQLDLGLRWREDHRPTAAWARRYDPGFEDAMGFLEQSRRARERERKRHRRRRRGAAAMVALVVLAAFLFFWNEAHRKEKEAIRRKDDALLRVILTEPDPLVRSLMLTEVNVSRVHPAISLVQYVAAEQIPLAVLRSREGTPLVHGVFDLGDSQVERAATVSSTGVVTWSSSDGRGASEEIRLLDDTSTSEGPLEIVAIAFSPDRERVLVALSNGRGLIGRSDGSIPLVDFQRGNQPPITALAFGPDGKRFALGRTNGFVEIRDRAFIQRVHRVASPEEAGKDEPMAHEGAVSVVQFDSSGQRLATASWHGVVRIWSLGRDGRPMAQEPVSLEVPTQRGELPPAVVSVAFSPDGEWVISGYSDGTTLIWRSDGTGKPVEVEGHTRSVTTVAFSPDGRKVVTGTEGATARIWDFERPASEGAVGGASLSGPVLVLAGHAGPVRSATFNSDGSRLVTSSADGTARVWWTESREPRVLGAHDKRVESAAFSPDGTEVVTASDDETARIWTLDGSRSTIDLEGHADWLRSAAFSADGSRVVTASEDCTVRIWGADGSPRLTIPAAAGGDVGSGCDARPLGAAFGPEGRRVVAGATDNRARIWRLDDPADPITLEGHSDWVWGASFSPDGTLVATASADGTARLWDASAGREIARLEGHRDRVLSVAFSADGSRLATGSADRTARVWSATGAVEMMLEIRHEDEVNDAVFSLDGTRLLTASKDGTARIWSTDDAREILVLRHGAEEEVWAAAFSPDGSHAITGSRDGRVRYWRVDFGSLVEFATGATTACLTEDERVRFLAESAAEARAEYERCEGVYGRGPTPP